MSGRKTRAESASRRIDPRRIAEVLAPSDNVESVHASVEGEVTHIWTVVRDGDHAALEEVFSLELVLHDEFGEDLAFVNFHVLCQADRLRRSDFGAVIFRREGTGDDGPAPPSSP